MFEARLNYRVKSKTGRATQRNLPVSKNKLKKNRNTGEPVDDPDSRVNSYSVRGRERSEVPSAAPVSSSQRSHWAKRHPPGAFPGHILSGIERGLETESL